MKPTRLLFVFCLSALAWFTAGPAAAQVSVTPSYSLYSTNAVTQNDTEFGVSAAADGNFFVVGARYWDGAAIDAGQVFVYDATTGALLYTIYPPAPRTSGAFGTTLALSGTRLVVLNGFLYVYDLSGATPTVPVMKRGR